MTRHGPPDEFCWMDLKTHDPSGTTALRRGGSRPSPWTTSTVSPPGPVPTVGNSSPSPKVRRGCRARKA